MRVLFITLGEISERGAGARSGALLSAIAEMGHRVDIVAARMAMPSHPNFEVMAGAGDKPPSMRRIRSAVGKATSERAYDAVHVVDAAINLLRTPFRLRKTPLIYDARRCFTGPHGDSPSPVWSWFPTFFGNRERTFLERAEVILAPCGRLADDLLSIAPEAHVERVEHVPLVGNKALHEPQRARLEAYFGGWPSTLFACGVSPENDEETRVALMSARKVLEGSPNAAFVFRGLDVARAKKLSADLDIAGRCLFVGESDSDQFLCALETADVALLISPSRGRYVCQNLLTFLAAPAPLVVVHDGEYDELLSDENSVRALNDVDSIAEALSRVMREPLFSIGVATHGQRLVAERFSASSFKHKTRMIYHEVFSAE